MSSTKKQAKVRQAPKEDPPPPPDPPVVVKDNRYTRKQINDRETLAKAIEELAEKVKNALDEDAFKFGRYARRMRLENHIKIAEGKKREEFLVVMPIAASCWNDVHLVDIELRIIKAVTENVPDHRHTWYRLRILFDEFIDPLTKDYLDKLDRGESLSPVDSPTYTSPPADSVNSPVASTSKQTPPSSATSTRKRAPPKAMEVDDDDDDVIFLD